MYRPRWLKFHQPKLSSQHLEFQNSSILPPNTNTCLWCLSNHNVFHTPLVNRLCQQVNPTPRTCWQNSDPLERARPGSWSHAPDNVHVQLCTVQIRLPLGRGKCWDMGCTVSSQVSTCSHAVWPWNCAWSAGLKNFMFWILQSCYRTFFE